MESWYPLAHDPEPSVEKLAPARYTSTVSLDGIGAGGGSPD